MSQHNIYIKCPEYLCQWITHTFGNPVVLIKDSPEMRLLNELLAKLPEGKTPDTGKDANIAIPIPYFRGKDPDSYNYIHETGKTALVESFSHLFKKCLFNEITALSNGHVRRATLIYAYMEKHGIDEKHWDTLAQIFLRLQDKYRKQKNVKVAK